MSKLKKSYVGKIGYCDNKNLGIKAKSQGHYVYIRKVYGKKCDVNIITSLERYNMPDPRKDKTAINALSDKKLFYARLGSTYPIPFNDSNFSKWSGIKKDVIKGVNLADIQDVGKKYIKKRHRFFIGKFMK